MSTDLELLEIRLPAITVKVNKSQSSEITEEVNSGEEDCRTPKIAVKIGGGDDEEYQLCQTPKSPKHMIPKMLSCPPAPRKTRKFAICKRKLCELQFFEGVARDEIDSFFRQFEDNNSKRSRCLV